MRQITCAILVVLAAIVGRADARTVKNEELNYTLVVPDRLQPVTPQAGMVDSFATSDPSKGIPDAVVTIGRLHGTIGREHLDVSKTPIPGISGAHVRQQKWKTFDIDVIEGEVKWGDARFATRGAQIPLKGEAIQINVLVPVGKEAQADALLSELLAGLDGPSNWLTDDERAEQLGRGVGKMAVWGALVVVGIIALLRWFRRSRS